MTRSILDDAVSCAEEGIPVFPCCPRTKRPLVATGFHAATTDLDQIRAWWARWPNAMIGRPMGPQSGCFAIDPDAPKEPGDPDGREAWQQLLERYGAVVTRTHATPNGGQHLLFLWDPKCPIRNRPGQLPAGIDVRGAGGYIILPPSVRADGRSYKVIDEAPIANPPDWLLAMLGSKLRQEREASAVPAWPAGHERYAAKASDAEIDKVVSAVHGRRNNTLNDAAFALGTLVVVGALDEADTRERLREAASTCGLSEEEAEATIESGIAAGMRNPRPPPPLRDAAGGAFSHVSQVKVPINMQFKTAGLGAPLYKSAKDFCAEYMPLSYVVEPIIRTASIYTLTAKTGGGKTALMTILALAVASGRCNLLDMETLPGRVAYLSFENPDDVRMRLMVSSHFYKIDLAAIGSNLMILDIRHKPEDLVAQLRDLTAEGEFTLIIVDTLSAAFDGQDVNDNVQAGEFIRRLRPITQLQGLPAVLIAAHPTKNAADDQLVPYGGGAILNEVDGNLSLAKKGAGTTLHWQGKFRGLEFRPCPFRFEIVASPDVIDKKGRRVQLPVLVRSTEDAFAQQAETEGLQTVQLLRAIADAPDGSTRAWAIAAGVAHGSMSRKLTALANAKLIAKAIHGRWVLTGAAKLKLKDLGCIG